MRRSEAHHAAVLEVALDCIVTIDSQGLIREFNPAAERTFGYTRDETLGKSISETLIPPSLRSAHAAGFAHYFATGEGPILQKRIEVPAMRKDGSEFPVELTVTPVQIEGETIFTAYIRDLTATRERERDLKESEERLHRTLEATHVGTWRWDLLANTLIWSESMYAMLGRSEDVEPTFESFIEWVHPDDRTAVQNAVTTSLRDKSEYDIELRVIWPDGSVHWHAAKGCGFYDASDIATHMEGLSIDVTERKRAEEELRTHADYEALQNKIGKAVRTLRDPDGIQQASAHALGELMQVDRCYFSFYDIPADTRWIGQDFRREGMPSLAGTYKISDFQVNPEDYHPDGQTLIVNDVETWSFPAPLLAAMKRLRVRAALAVPIYDAGRLSATLTVAMADTTRFWTDAEIALVEAVALQTRNAVEEARAQQRESRIATALQAALQPLAPDVIPGLEIAPFMKPALEEASIGGDFYDVFALNATCYALVIGDVSGKGLAAAAQLATVRNMLRTVLYQKAPLDESISDLNAILTNHDLLTGYVTVFCSVYDSTNSTLKYVSCGHEPGLLRRSDGALETLDPCGPPLGVAEQARYMARSITLAKHDTLLLYTDGLSEAGVTRLSLLGTTGLIRLLTGLPADLSLPEAAQRIVAGAGDFAHGVFRDDICVLMARR
nr:SpoIIE family protein phosphatase [Capsulimonas corticalis]